MFILIQKKTILILFIWHMSRDRGKHYVKIIVSIALVLKFWFQNIYTIFKVENKGDWQKLLKENIVQCKINKSNWINIIQYFITASIRLNTKKKEIFWGIYWCQWKENWKLSYIKLTEHTYPSVNKRYCCLLQSLMNKLLFYHLNPKM